LLDNYAFDPTNRFEHPTAQYLCPLNLLVPLFFSAPFHRLANFVLHYHFTHYVMRLLGLLIVEHRLLHGFCAFNRALPPHPAGSCSSPPAVPWIFPFLPLPRNFKHFSSLLPIVILTQCMLAFHIELTFPAVTSSPFTVFLAPLPSLRFPVPFGALYSLFLRGRDLR